jgi:hypothetical protein
MCALDELLQAIAAANNDAAKQALFGSTTSGNIDLFSVWAVWGDVNDDDIVDWRDLILIGQYIYDQIWTTIDQPGVFNPVLNTRPGQVTISDALYWADFVRIEQYIYDQIWTTMGWPAIFGAILGRP